MINKDEFLKYLYDVRKYSNNTIINYELDLNIYEKYLFMKKMNIREVKYLSLIHI